MALFRACGVWQRREAQSSTMIDVSLRRYDDLEAGILTMMMIVMKMIMMQWG